MPFRIQEEVEEDMEVEGEVEWPLPLSDLGVSKPESSPSQMTRTGGHPLEQSEHHLEVTEHQPQDSDSSANKLDVQEAGITPPSFFHPLSKVAPSDAVLSGAIATHLSDPLSSAPPLSGPSLLSQPCGDQDDIAEELQTLQAKGDVGPEPVVFVPRRPSPFPEVVAGVREALYTAWIPSPWTQALLSQPHSVTQDHLTCPGLVADIKRVRV